MLGIKKKKDLEIHEAEISGPPPKKALDFLLKEYVDGYHNVFLTKDLDNLDQEATTLNLLFAIYGELRQIRQILEKPKE